MVFFIFIFLQQIYNNKKAGVFFTQMTRDAAFYTESCRPYVEFYLQRLLKNEVGLIQLNLISRNVDDDNVEELMNALNDNTEVKKIILDDNNISDVGLGMIAELLRRNETIVEVSVAANKLITDKGIKLLTESMLINNSVLVTTIDRIDNITPSVKNSLQLTTSYNSQPIALKNAIVSILECKNSVQKIDLSEPSVPSKPFNISSAKLIAGLICSCSTLVYLDLSNNNKGDEVTGIISKAVADHPCLVELHLSSNCITDVGAKYLCDSLRNNTTVTELGLYDNIIGNRGAAMFVDLVTINETISHVKLDKNNISPEQRSRVVHSLLLNSQPAKLKLIYESLFLNDSSIRTVHIDGLQQPDDKQLNGISCRVLFNCLDGNTTVKKLILPNNRIEDEGAESLSLLIQRNRHLEVVNLRGNRITSKGCKLLTEALSRNTSIKLFDISDQVPNPIPVEELSAMSMQLSLNAEPFALKQLIPLLISNDPSAAVVDLGSLNIKIKSNISTYQLLKSGLENNTFVKEIILDNNKTFGEEYNSISGFNILIDVFLRSELPLTILSLSNTSLTDDSIGLISRLLVESGSIISINLSNNCFTKVKQWTSILLDSNHTLTDFDLSNSCVGVSKEHLSELSTVLKMNAQPLKFKKILLQAYSNDEELTSICLVDYESLGGSNYKYSRRYDDKSIELLSDSLKENTNVSKLDISSNRIGDKGAVSIASLLQQNRSITTISMSNNYVTDQGFRVIADSLIVNPTLSCIIVDGNLISDPSTRKHLNLATCHNAALPLDIYGKAVAEVSGFQKKIEEAIAADALLNYNSKESLQMTMKRLDEPLYK